ncbi:MAG: hypothetical protein QNJ31_06360 [Candidatus Caenarcaniphilales bacterium]|nr:hypothetical protein [Candidatus Caenarcaniphilales bacterium]
MTVSIENRKELYKYRKIKLPNFIERRLPKTAEELRKLDERLQENVLYGANFAAATIVNIPTQLIVNDGNFQKAMYPLLLVASYDLASIVIQALSWKVGAKYLQPMITKAVGVSSEYNESIKGIVGKLLSLMFWVGVFPIVNSYFDSWIKKLYLGLTGKLSDEESKGENNESEKPKNIIKTFVTLGLTLIGAAGLTFLFKRPLRKSLNNLVSKIDLKKINELLLDIEQFIFIPICGLVRLLVEHFMNHKNWKKAFEDTLPFLMIQSANFVAQIGVVISKRVLVKNLRLTKFVNIYGSELPINKLKYHEPSSVQNIAFSIICGLKDLFIPVIGLMATGFAESYLKNDSQRSSMALA